MAKGKKLTVARMRILNKNGVDDVSGYRYLKTEYVDASGNKCPSKLKDKIERMVVWNDNKSCEETYIVRSI